PIVVAIEDIDLADPATVLFFEQIAFRAFELPLRLVLTKEPTELEPKWLDTFTASLGPNFLRVRLSPFSEQESETLVQFLENKRERQLSVLQLSAGNPLFIERCLNSPNLDSAPESLAEAATSMLAKLTKDTCAVLQVLSVFRKAVYVTVLVTMYHECHIELETRLDV